MLHMIVIEIVAATILALFASDSGHCVNVEKAKCIVNFDMIKNFTDCYREVTGHEYEIDRDDEELKDAEKVAIFECSDKRAGIMDDTGHFYEEKALSLMEAHGYFDADDNVIQEVKNGIHECYLKYGDDDHFGLYTCWDKLFDEVCDMII